MNRFGILACLGLLVLGQPASADDLKIVVILDNSGSMNEYMSGGKQKVDAAKSALLTVLDQVPAGSEVGVLLLNDGPRGPWLVPLGPIDPATFRPAINALTANGGTPLGATMKKAADELLKLRDKQRYGTYKLLIVSDGEAGDGYLVDQYLPEIQARGLLVDVIGVAMSQEHSLATRASTYRRADDPASLEKAISAVVLGESSADASDDTGESDFELLKPLPTELAAASLTALTSPVNKPLEESSRPAYEDTSQSSPYQPRGPIHQPPANQGNGGGGGWSKMPILLLAVVFIVIRVLVGIAKRK
ncbi:vWA domain-containing protein [Blastopirellula marina]|nr:vWA domain-containing protein [Blastopirellula marina]